MRRRGRLVDATRYRASDARPLASALCGWLRETARLHPLSCRVALRRRQAPSDLRPKVSLREPASARDLRLRDCSVVNRFGLASDAELDSPDREFLQHAIPLRPRSDPAGRTKRIRARSEHRPTSAGEL